MGAATRPSTTDIWRGMAAGLGATFILTMFMLIKSALGVVPQGNAIQALVKVSTLWVGSPLAPWVGWAEHYFIGTILWGIGYAIVVEPILPGAGWMKGLLFGIGAWIVMMVLLLPPAGAGWFGVSLGISVPVITLAFHLIYGFCLGTFYELLGRRR